jgi:hypothetical protein
VTVHDFNIADDGEAIEAKRKQKRYLLLIPKKGEQHEKLAKFLKSDFALKKQEGGVYIVRGNPKKLRKLLSEVTHIIFTRARQIPKGNNLETPDEFLAYKIVAYSLPKSTVQQRKKVQRLCEKAGALKIHRGVLLFPQLRKKDYKRFYSKASTLGLLDAKKISESLREAGAYVSRWTRLRPLGTRSNDVLEGLVSSASRTELKRLNRRIKGLLERSKKQETKLESLKSTYSSLRNQIRRLRIKYSLLYRIWGLDAKKEIHSSYNRLLRVKKHIMKNR